ncbi:MAG TPA: chromate efflux transporter [Blastocatellia bacterium]|nr:chromate efflux transporter [Blastocatellia bacterium]
MIEPETANTDNAERRESPTKLKQLALLFFKLGVVSFGGPAAHIAMMENEVVRRRRWLSRDEFLDLLGATNLIPGPNSTELAIHIGRRQAGWPGLLVAGSCFILPATFIVTALAWAYVRYGSLPQADALLYGVKPVVIAIILQALWGLGRAALKTKTLALVGAVGILLNFLGVHELVILFGAGIATGIGSMVAGRMRRGESLSLIPAAFLFRTTALAAPATSSFGLWPLFFFFLKVGSVLFGSGYVLLAFLQADLVERWRWLTEPQLLDALTAGQVTPGPVFTTATFIGYVLGGLPGAIVATMGIFLPAFFFVAVSGPLLPRIRRSATAGAVLDGVNAASMSLMAVVTWRLGRAALVDWTTVALLIVSLILLIRFRISSAWLVPVGALFGLLLFAWNKI